ncbi:MAG: hypothetical protein DWP97_06180 [Calditrichaeota bacterium]|nr:MAG: hypothetical protein DWP97_06180 [Calditrichota bacterium]
MHKLKIIFLVAIFIPIISYATPKKIYLQNGIVEVDVLVNDSIEARFGIDTGADRLYISKSFADEYGIDYTRAAGQRFIQTNFGSAEPHDAVLSSLKLNNEFELFDYNVTVIDFINITRDTIDGLAGLIGNQVLKDYFITIDYSEEWIDISKKRPRFLATANSVEIPFSWYQDQMIVTVTIGNIMTFPMVFDFCASNTVISKEAGELIGIDEDLNMVRLNQIDLSGLVINDRVVTRVMDLNPLKNRMRTSGIEGVLGMSFLKDYTITIDYKSQIIYFQR